MKSSACNIRSFHKQSWTVAPSGGSSCTFSSSSPIRFATWNILADTFPAIVEMTIDSPARFKALPAILAEVDATVLAMQEVTRRSLDAVLGDNKIKAMGYNVTYFEDVGVSGAAGQSNYDRLHGCALFSKLDIVVAERVETDSACHPIIAVLKLPSNDSGIISSSSSQPTQFIVVAAVHTTAYATEKTRQLRAVQLSRVKVACESMLLREVAKQQGAVGCAVIIMGDLNLHDMNEQKIVQDIKMMDAWAETRWRSTPGTSNRHGGDGQGTPLQLSKLFPGFTFNAATNAMIPRYIPGETRLMRLDRILVSVVAGSPWDSASSRGAVHGGDDQITAPAAAARGSGAVWAGPCTMFGDAAVNKDREIWPSDHYGLFVDISSVTDPAAAAAGAAVVVGALPLVPDPLVAALLAVHAALPNDQTGVSLGFFGNAMKAVSFVAHLGFLLKRSITNF